MLYSILTMIEIEQMDEFLQTTIENNRYYNFALLPFNYIDFIKKKTIIEQIKVIKETTPEYKEAEKNKLQKIIYTELYKLNTKEEAILDYFQKSISTDKYKMYLGMAFKFSIQYNKGENPYITTFIHLAQLYIADMCYEYLWRLEHQQK
ncbi:MAG: hypothetical protein A2Y40_03070 [Candidatus Margulisbacteria bacterium GWF2_35_9]|nr:MAG: hypothetical protein A2Y40_03070 [Candidatus Margulisbacteria bacterium GWF2_35_9]